MTSQTTFSPNSQIDWLNSICALARIVGPTKRLKICSPVTACGLSAEKSGERAGGESNGECMNCQIT